MANVEADNTVTEPTSLCEENVIAKARTENATDQNETTTYVEAGKTADLEPANCELEAQGEEMDQDATNTEAAMSSQPGSQHSNENSDKCILSPYEQNEMPDSDNLVIDEQEYTEFDENSESMKISVQQNDELKDSCEDISEVSAVTQIAAGENEGMDAKICGLQGTKSSSSTEQKGAVIEIDDEEDDVNLNTLQNTHELKTIAIENMDTKNGKTCGVSVSKEVGKFELAEETSNSTTNLELTVEDKEISPQSKCSPEKTEDCLLKEVSRQTEYLNLSDGNEELIADEIFYNKECINYDCRKNHKQYYRSPQFALNCLKLTKKKSKAQFICVACYDDILAKYEMFCGHLNAKQPLLMNTFDGARNEFVEIIDSSDEEDTNSSILDKENESSYFSKNIIDFVEEELDNTIKNVLDDVEIQAQLTWVKTILQSRTNKLQEENLSIEKELQLLQKQADKMHHSLYQCPKYQIKQLQSLDINIGRPHTFTDLDTSILPPVGEVPRPPVKENEVYYAVKNKAIGSWIPCRVIEKVEVLYAAHKNVPHYKIKFNKAGAVYPMHKAVQLQKTVSAKHLAYFEPPAMRLPIGSRVIAFFDSSSLSRDKAKEKSSALSAFYPGIIAEPLKASNKYRYLIFYDDGYTQYVYHRDVRLVCHVSDNVWEDVDAASRQFIQKYLTQYSINRPMVQTQKGQSMYTESDGRWIYARVIDMDCSLIHMQFEGQKDHTEWIYRGSLRLGPVYKEYEKSIENNSVKLPISRLSRRTEPFIRYTEDLEASADQQYSSEPRAVAKKTVSRQETQSLSSAATSSPSAPTVRHLNNSTIYLEDENKPRGKVVYYTAKRNIAPVPFSPHTCSPKCLFPLNHNLNAYSPLSKPLLSGWERLIIRQRIKKVIAYRAPCGRILRNMREVRDYLRKTFNSLNVDNFDFCSDTNCLAEYVIESAFVQKRDISNGQEKMALPLVNYYDSTLPPECKYAAQRIPTEGVNLNLNEEFLCGCDCEDDCLDKEKCACWLLTYGGAKYGNPNTPREEIGYQYKRLYEHVPTGIYECNSRCKCKSSCLNRVVQESLQMKLQVFKTSNRGWGLRCLNDIPKGSFICIYAGHLLTESKANEGGLDAGDEYFAELDYIEVAEQIKEGYESEVESGVADDDEEFEPEKDDDDEFTPSKPYFAKAKMKRQRSTRSNTTDDSTERRVINFNPNADMTESSPRDSSMRQLFGKDEACYVMDAKVTGNLGRYFNHSCSPNLFVQNVFVDTHDLRFPWVAFFASTHIRSGTELTWNYNYEVGVVPGKVLFCQCGAPNCRVRLL